MAHIYYDRYLGWARGQRKKKQAAGRGGQPTRQQQQHTRPARQKRAGQPAHKQQQWPAQPVHQPRDATLVFPRLGELLAKYKHGMFVPQLAANYNKKYGWELWAGWAEDWAAAGGPQLDRSLTTPVVRSPAHPQTMLHLSIVVVEAVSGLGGAVPTFPYIPGCPKCDGWVDLDSGRHACEAAGRAGYGARIYHDNHRDMVLVAQQLNKCGRACGR